MAFWDGMELTIAKLLEWAAQGHPIKHGQEMLYLWFPFSMTTQERVMCLREPMTAYQKAMVGKTGEQKGKYRDRTCVWVPISEMTLPDTL